MKKLNPNDKVVVDIVCRFPVAIDRTTLAGVYKSVTFSVSNLRMLIAGKAKVDRVLSNNQRIRVGFDNYDEDFEAELVEKKEAALKKAQEEAEKVLAEKKTKEAAKVSAPVKNVEEKKETIKAGEAPKAEPVKKENKPQQQNANKK